jgi:integrase
MAKRGKGEGSIYRAADGMWRVSIDLGWVEGKRKRRYFRAQTHAEALRKLHAFQNGASVGVQLAPELLTVGQYLDRWVTTRIPGTVSVRTEEIYARVIRLYVSRHLGKIRLNKLTPTDVNAMMIALEKQGLSPSTKRMARATLRRALRMAEQDGLITRNVAAIAEGPKMDLREGRTLTPEQAQIFLNAVTGNRLEAAYVLALALGLRRGEIIGLSWSDIELVDDTVVLTIRRQLVRDRTGVHLSELKTKGSRRTLHLSAPLVHVLESHRVNQDAEAAIRGPRWRNDWNLIFTSTHGTPLDPEWFGKTVSKITTSAGLGHWSMHELRHSCASLLIAMEVPLEVIAEQMGHASIRVTKDVYGHLLPGSKAKAAKAMEQMLFGDFVDVLTPRKNSLAASSAAVPAATVINIAVTRDSVGRPGLDPGTLGLKGTGNSYCCVALVDVVYLNRRGARDV